MRLVRLLSLAALALAACTDASRAPTAPPDGPAFAAADAQTIRITSQLSGTVTDPCSGQVITISGSGNFVLHETFTEHGLLLTGHFNTANVKGVATDGTRYVSSQASNELIHLHFDNGSIQQSNPVTFRLTSLGAADDLLLHATVHVTLTPQGVVTAVVDRFRMECTG